MALADAHRSTDLLQPELADFARALAQGRTRWLRALSPDECRAAADMAEAAATLHAFAAASTGDKIRGALKAAADPEAGAALARWWAAETLLAAAGRLADDGQDVFRTEEGRRAALIFRLDDRLRRLAYVALHGARRHWPDMPAALQHDAADAFLVYVRTRLDRAAEAGLLPASWLPALLREGKGGR